MNFPTSALAAVLASFFCLSAPVVAVNASSSESIALSDAIEEVVVTAEFRNVAVNRGARVGFTISARRPGRCG